MVFDCMCVSHYSTFLSQKLLQEIAAHGLLPNLQQLVRNHLKGLRPPFTIPLLSPPPHLLLPPPHLLLAPPLLLPPSPSPPFPLPPLLLLSTPPQLVISPPVISMNTFVMVLKILSTLCSTCPALAVELLRLSETACSPTPKPTNRPASKGSLYCWLFSEEDYLTSCMIV